MSSCYVFTKIKERQFFCGQQILTEVFIFDSPTV